MMKAKKKWPQNETLDGVSIAYDHELRGVIDEIMADSTHVHIERMNNQYYWMKVGDTPFKITNHKGRIEIRKQVEEI